MSGFLLLFSSLSAVFLLLLLLQEVNFCPDFVLCNVVNLARHQRALIKCPAVLIKRFCLEAVLSKTQRNIVYAVAKQIVCKTFNENLVQWNWGKFRKKCVNESCKCFQLTYINFISQLFVGCTGIDAHSLFVVIESVQWKSRVVAATAISISSKLLISWCWQLFTIHTSRGMQ